MPFDATSVLRIPITLNLPFQMRRNFVHSTNSLTFYPVILSRASGVVGPQRSRPRFLETLEGGRRGLLWDKFTTQSQRSLLNPKMRLVVGLPNTDVSFRNYSIKTTTRFLICGNFLKINYYYYILLYVIMSFDLNSNETFCFVVVSRNFSWVCNLSVGRSFTIYLCFYMNSL